MTRIARMVVATALCAVSAFGAPTKIREGGQTDSTTVGTNIVKLANPGAITFLRINADNSVTAQSATNFRADLSLDLTQNFNFLSNQSFFLDDANNTTVQPVLTIYHTTSGTPTNGLGTGISFQSETSTTNPSPLGSIGFAWSDVTNATAASYLDVQARTGGTAATSKMRVFGSGGLSVNSTTDPGAGIVNANTGFKLANAEFPIASNGLVNRTAANTYSAKTAPSGAILGDTDTQTVTNKRLSNRTGTTTSSATPTINTDNVDFYSLTAQAADITSFTTNLTGTPVEGDTLWIAITGTASRAITWGASFESGPATLPTTTSGTTRLDVAFIWNTVTTKWRCIGSSAVDVSDTAYASSWDGVTTIAPSKNAVYDELHKIDSADDGTIVNAGTGFKIAGAAASRKILVGDGTKFSASVETWPVPATAGNGMVSDGTNWTSADVGGWTIVKVSGSDATTTGQALVDITGLVSGTLTASTKYEIEVVLDVLTSTGTAGCQYGVTANGTGSVGVNSVILTGNTTGTAASDEALSTTPGIASTARLLTASQSGTIVMKGFVTTRSTGTDTISVQHLKVTSGTSTVKIGSVLKYRKA